MAANQRRKRIIAVLGIIGGILLAFGFARFAAPPAAQAAEAATTANNIILFVGDGMGPEHVKAGRMFINGDTDTLAFEKFLYQTTMTHMAIDPADPTKEVITDSAASATAMATGYQVEKYVVSVNEPGDRLPLDTLLEIYKGRGKSTGLVSTAYITDATPAAFAAHQLHRNMKEEIFEDYLKTRPTLFLGGGGNEFDGTAAAAAGYTVVSTRSELAALLTETTINVAGGFGGGSLPAEGMSGRSPSLPTLPEMTETALKILDNDPDGLFLVVEHGGTDTYSHANDTEGVVRSVKELEAAVQKALDWKAEHPDTIIIVTADHETGGLFVNENNPQEGVVPSVEWQDGAKYHTARPVPVYGTGAGAEQILDETFERNSDIFTVLSPTEVGATADLVQWIWAGAVTTDSARVNARVKASSEDVTLLVSEFSDLSSPTTAGPLSANSGNANTVSFDLSGLAPDRRYHYAVKIGAEIDDLHRGTFETFPSGPFSFTFAFSGDAKKGSNMPVFDAVREENARFFLSPGDFMYSDIGDDNVDLYRSAFAQTLSAARQSALYRSLPIAYMWDDHDYATNDSDSTAPSRPAARSAYQEIVPHYPLAAGSGDVPIYQAFNVGRAYFIMTDLRSERFTPEEELALAGAEPAVAAQPTMMGETQLAWFKVQLDHARDRGYAPIFWVSSVPWIDPAEPGTDQWGGFHAERVDIANHIETENIENVVILSADVHMLGQDDGTNSQYATVGGDPVNILVFQAAALNRSGSVKGTGPYSGGAFPNLSEDDGQYALVEVTDTGGSEVGVRFVGKRLPAETLNAVSAAGAVEETEILIDYSTTLTPAIPTAVDLLGFSAAGGGTSGGGAQTLSQVALLLLALCGVTLLVLRRSPRPSAGR